MAYYGRNRSTSNILLPFPLPRITSVLQEFFSKISHVICKGEND
jgi:hypothetical protein